MKSLSVLFILVFEAHFSIVISQNGNLGCYKNRDGAVDWFVVYKPTGRADVAWFIEPGAANAFTAGTFNALETSPLKATIDRYLLDPNKVNMASVAYSNHPPYFSKPLPLSTAKGVVLMGTEKSSWIVHTLPQFTNMDVSQLMYTPPSSKTGIALCLTIRDNVAQIFNLLSYADAIMYYQRAGNPAPPMWNDDLIRSYLFGNTPQQPPFVTVYSGTTDGGTAFRGIARDKAIPVDMFSRFVTRILNVPLKVRFDTSQRHVLPNHCVGATPTSNIGGTIRVATAQPPQGQPPQGQPPQGQPPQGQPPQGQPPQGQPPQGQPPRMDIVAATDEGTVWAVDGRNLNNFCVGDGPRTAFQEQLGSLITCVTQSSIYAVFNTIAQSAMPMPTLCPGTS